MEETKQPQIVKAEDVFATMFGEKQTEVKEEVVVAEDGNPVLPEPPKPLEGDPVKVEKEPVKVTDYSKKIQTLLDTGFVDDYEVDLDGEKVFLSELNIEDEETYKTLLESIKSERENTLKSKYISIDDMDETTKKIYEIRKAGGDITSILQENVQAIDQLTNLRNMLIDGDSKDRESLAINILTQNLQQKGLTARGINAQLEDYIESGNLEDEATKIIDSRLSSHKEAMEQKRKLEVERMEQEIEEQKTFKKTLSQTLKKFNLPENIQRVILDNTTKVDEHGIANTDKIFFEAKKDPEFFGEISFFLNNRDLFKKWVSDKQVLSVKKEAIRPTLTINTSNVKKQPSSNSVDGIFEKMFENKNK